MKFFFLNCVYDFYYTLAHVQLQKTTVNPHNFWQYDQFYVTHLGFLNYVVEFFYHALQQM